MAVHLLQWDKAHPDQVLLDLLCLPYLLSCLSFQWGPIEYKIIRWVHTISSFFFFFFIAATLSFCHFYSKSSWRFLRSLGFLSSYITDIPKNYGAPQSRWSTESVLYSTLQNLASKTRYDYLFWKISRASKYRVENIPTPGLEPGSPGTKSSMLPIWQRWLT